MKTPRVTCIGEGLIVLVPTEPGPLEDAATFSRGTGGAELNVAIGLAAAGIHSSLLTRVGDDGFGRHLVSVAASNGVDVAGVDVDSDRPTGLYFKEVGGDTALPTDLGRGNSRMHYFRTASASSAFSPAFLRLPAVAARLHEADLIHTTGITAALSAGALDMTLELLSMPRGSRLASFDVNWRPQLWRGREADGVRAMSRLAGLSDVVLIGASEALVVYGTADPDELRRLLPEPRYLVVKNDGNAATAFDGERRIDVDAFSVTVVEAIGAGDAFAAGFLAALVSGRGLDESLLEAHRLAVVALGSTGDHVGAATRVNP